MLRRLCWVLSAVALSYASACATRQAQPTVPQIRNEGVAYAGRAGTGGLDIDAAEPGVVSVDGVPVGRAPAHVANLQPGEHSVELMFDEGDSSSTTASVLPGRIATARVSGSKLREVGHAREGAHWLLGGGVFAGDGVSLYRGLVGADVQGGLNYGLGPRFDFRLVGHIELSDDDDLWYEFGASAGFRLNLSSVFSMELGARLSLMPARGDWYDDEANKRTVKVALGAELALLSFRLGADRSNELTLWHALQTAIGGSAGSAAFRTGLSFVHVWN